MMSYLYLYLIWACGTDVIFAFIYIQSPQADTELGLLHSTFNGYASIPSQLTEPRDPAIELFQTH